MELITGACDCGLRWRSLVQAHCASCHRHFGGVTGFDRHRRNGSCLDPSLLGYEEIAGVWRKPISEAELAQKSRASLSAFDSERLGAGSGS